MMMELIRAAKGTAMDNGSPTLGKRIEDFMDPKPGQETTAIGWVFRIIAWILYGIFFLAALAIGMLLLAAFVGYVIPGTNV